MEKQQSSSKALHIVLWIAQVLLAFMFVTAGIMKTVQPIDVLSQQLPWAAQVPEALVRFIGISEAAGAAGLILPALLRFKTNLIPLAALGLALIMFLASVFHLSQGEVAVIPMNLVLGGIALFVAWGRYKKVSIREKGTFAIN